MQNPHTDKTAGPKRYVDELVHTLLSKYSPPAHEDWQLAAGYCCEIVVLLTRYAVQAGGEESTKKAFDTLTHLLNGIQQEGNVVEESTSSSSSTLWLDGEFNETSKAILTTFGICNAQQEGANGWHTTRKLCSTMRVSTQDCLGVGAEGPSPLGGNSSRTQATVETGSRRTEQPAVLRAWHEDVIHKFFTHYFGCSSKEDVAEPAQANRLDIVVLLFRSLAVLARSLAIGNGASQRSKDSTTTSTANDRIGEADMLHAIHSFCNSTRPPPELATRMRNWLSLVDLSAGVTLAVCRARRQPAGYIHSRRGQMRRGLRHASSPNSAETGRMELVLLSLDHCAVQIRGLLELAKTLSKHAETTSRAQETPPLLNGNMAAELAERVYSVAANYLYASSTLLPSSSILAKGEPVRSGLTANGNAQRLEEDVASTMVEIFAELAEGLSNAQLLEIARVSIEELSKRGTKEGGYKNGMARKWWVQCFTKATLYLSQRGAQTTLKRFYEGLPVKVCTGVEPSLLLEAGFRLVSSYHDAQSSIRDLRNLLRHFADAGTRWSNVTEEERCCERSGDNWSTKTDYPKLLEQMGEEVEQREGDKFVELARNLVEIFNTTRGIFSTAITERFASVLIRLCVKTLSGKQPSVQSINLQLDLVEALSCHYSTHSATPGVINLLAPPVLEKISPSTQLPNHSVEMERELHSVLFELLYNLMLNASDLDGFNLLMMPVLADFTSILRMAQPSGWVLASEREFGLLHLYCTLFLRLPVAARSGIEGVREKLQKHVATIEENCTKLINVCADHLQTSGSSYPTQGADKNDENTHGNPDEGSKCLVKLCRLFATLSLTRLIVQESYSKVSLQLEENLLASIRGDVRPEVKLGIVTALFQETYKQIPLLFIAGRGYSHHRHWDSLPLLDESEISADDEASTTERGGGSETPPQHLQDQQLPSSPECNLGVLMQPMLLALKQLHLLISSLTAAKTDPQSNTWPLSERKWGWLWHKTRGALRTLYDLNPSCLDRPLEHTLLDRLFELTDSILTITRCVPAQSANATETASIVVELVGRLLTYRPSADALNRLFSLCHLGPAIFESVANTLHSIFRAKGYGPSESLLFPQARMQAETEDPEEDPSSRAVAESKPAQSTTAATLTLPRAELSLTKGLSASFWIRPVAAQCDDSGDSTANLAWCHLATISWGGAAMLQVDVRRDFALIRARLSTCYADKELCAVEEKFFHTKAFCHSISWFNVTFGLECSDDGELRAIAAVGNRIQHLSIADKRGGEQLRLIETEAAAACSFDDSGNSPLQFHIGCVSTGNSSHAVCEATVYEMSTLFIFEGLASPKHVLLLRAVGSGHISLVKCALSPVRPSILANCAVKSTICSPAIDLEKLVENEDVYMEQLKDHLLLTIRPSTAHCCTLKNATKRITSFHSSPSERGINPYQSRQVSTPCAAGDGLPLEWRTLIVKRHQPTIDEALETIGGLKLFLFLYALSVDKAHPPKAQLAALRLIFTLLKRDPTYHASFYHDINGPSLLVQLLSSSSACFDTASCDQLLEATFSKLERVRNGGRPVSHTQEEWRMCATPRTVIVEPLLLQTLLSYAEIWRGERFKYWATLIRVLAEASAAPSARNTTSCYPEFNLRQLVRVDFLPQLLSTLLDMFQSKHDYCLEKEGKIRVVRTEHVNSPTTATSMGPAYQQQELHLHLYSLVAELVGQPPSFNEVRQLWDFLLLSHPAHDTYLDYSPRSHNSWLRIGRLVAGEEPRMSGHSELSALLSEVLDEYGAEQVAQHWNESNNSAIAVRRWLLSGSSEGMMEQRSGPSAPSSTMTITPREPAAGKAKFCRMNSVENPPLRPECLRFPEEEKDGEWEASTLLNQMHSTVAKWPHGGNTSENAHEQHWLIQLRAELLQLMADTVLNSDDSLMRLIEDEVLHWQTILVLLSKQCFRRIRVLTFTLMKNFLLRCSPVHRSSFVQKQGFLLLSNELRQATVVSDRMADALFSLTCGEHVRLRDGLDLAHVERISYDSFKLSSFYALYTLLEESLSSDASLFWSVCSTLQKIFIAENAPRRAMLEMGLIDTMASVLYRLCELCKDSAENCQDPHVAPTYALLECWISFAQSILLYLVPFRGAYNYSTCEDFLWLCIAAAYQWDNDGEARMAISLQEVVRNQAGAENDPEAEAQHHSYVLEAEQAMRKVVCQMLYCWIDSIQSALCDQFRQRVHHRIEQKYPQQPSVGLVTNTEEGFVDESEYEVIRPVSEWQINYEGLYKNESTFGVGMAINSRADEELAPLEEMARRLLFALTMTKDFFLYTRVPWRCSDEEETLFRFFIDTVLAASWRKRHSERHNDEWNAVLLMCREEARSILAEMIAFVLFPAESRCRAGGSEEGHSRRGSTDSYAANDSETTPSGGVSSGDIVGTGEAIMPFPLRRRLMMVRFLAGEVPHSRHQLMDLLEVNLDYQYAMKLALHELALLPSIVRPYAAALTQYDAELERLIRFLRSVQIDSPLANLTRDEVSSLANDEILLLHSYHQAKQRFCAQLATRAANICGREHAMLKFTSDRAMSLTCEINDYQNAPRKAFIHWRKEQICRQTEAVAELGVLVRELCHPAAPFHDPSSWPIGRVLDTTESPTRERRRFRPQHYDFPWRFLKRERRRMVEASEAKAAPLDSVTQSEMSANTRNNTHGLGHSRPSERVEAIKRVKMSITATMLRTSFECSGEVVIADERLYFLGEQAKSTQKGVIRAPVNHSWSYEQIREVHPRHYLLKDTALELFTSVGDAHLLVFSNTAQRNLLLEQLATLCGPAVIADIRTQLRMVMQLWRAGGMTNFDYLMALNKLAGRSFNDLMQYPVFPFVLAIYASPVLDLKSPSSYRNLSRPMAIQDTRMEAVYQRNYQSLLEEWERHNERDNASPASNRSPTPFSAVRFGAYHFGSHYSNTGIVTHYLVRIPPYVSVALEYQDNSFDVPDRLFSNLDTTWRLSSSESTTDFKELIPEFFYLHEMFINGEGLELGVKQGGQQVNDVHLPEWVPRGGDPRLFCLVHRQALESDYVTANLHLWMDLIFGYKQRGEAAIKATNTFHPATYRGQDLEKESGNDELSVSAIRTMVRTYGQMPGQLLASPHLPYLDSEAITPMRGTVQQCGLELFSSVQGLKWGEFVGSPDCKWCLNESLAIHLYKPAAVGDEKLNHLVAIQGRGSNRWLSTRGDSLPSGCYGLPPGCELIASYKVDRRDPLRRGTELMATALLSWNSPTNVLRIKPVTSSAQPHPAAAQPHHSPAPQSAWTNLFELQTLQVSTVTFSSDSDQLFLGFKCGLIRAYTLMYSSVEKLWKIMGATSELLAHTCQITTLRASEEFHILLSTSMDALVVVWDINRLEFVNRFDQPQPSRPGEAVTLSCVSSTSGDIACVFQSGFSSRVALYTINGKLVGVHEEERLTITALAMTDLAEGKGINCLAVGLQSGSIRLIDMWTISVVREIPCTYQCGNPCTEPITSIQFTNESRRLYAALANSQVLCWQVASLPQHQQQMRISASSSSLTNQRELHMGGGGGAEYFGANSSKKAAGKQALFAMLTE